VCDLISCHGTVTTHRFNDGLPCPPEAHLLYSFIYFMKILISIFFRKTDLLLLLLSFDFHQMGVINIDKIEE
jgi:hypothetical protein